MNKLFVWSKKIHRLVMWLAVFVGGFMSVSGFVMHRELEGEYIPDVVDTLFLRQWHNNFSTIFGLILWGMIITGFLMWILPKIISRRNSVDRSDQ